VLEATSGSAPAHQEGGSLAGKLWTTTRSTGSSGSGGSGGSSAGNASCGGAAVLMPMPRVGSKERISLLIGRAEATTRPSGWFALHELLFL
jgi:hypothetical protein